MKHKRKHKSTEEGLFGLDSASEKGMRAQRSVAIDYFRNAAARMGLGTPSLTESTEYDLVRFSYDYWTLITLYQNHWISRRIVDTPAQDMVKAWPRLTSEIDPKDLTLIDRCIRTTGVKPRILKTLQLARLFGGAGALIVIDGQENQLDKPLDFDKVGLGAFKGLIPFDRWSGIQPLGRVSADFTKPLEFNLPELYRVNAPDYANGFDVHASRILRFTGPMVPTPEYEAMQWWGISVLEPAFEEIRKRDNLSWNLISLSFRASLLGIVYPELSQALSGAGMTQVALEKFQQRMQAMNNLLSTQSLLMLPKEGSLQSINQSMTGWADLYQQFQLDIAGAAEIPVTKLFGRTLTGLGQSNDADMRIYEQKIAMEQDVEMRPQLEKLYAVICMSELGEVPEDLDLLFPSVMVLDQREKADLAKTVSETIVSMYSAGIFKRSQALKEVKQSSDITEIGTNVTDEDIAEAEKDDILMPAPFEEEPSGEEGSEEKTGNTKDASLEYCGFPVTIEVPAGQRRTIFNDKGKMVYDRLLRYDYGFINGTIGDDGDEVDVVLGPHAAADKAYVIWMHDLGPDVGQRCDEDKVFLGFTSTAAARAAFLTMYPPSFMGATWEVDLEGLRQWLSEED